MSKPRPAHSISSIKGEVAEWIRIIHERDRAADERERTPGKWLEWKRADTAFLSFKPDFGYGWDNYVATHIHEDPTMLEFAIAFLEFDPWFFRSGYIKAKFLERMKGSSLCETQRTRLNAILHDAVLNRPGREYRRYCRLARLIASQDLIDELERVSSETGAAPARARMMLEHIRM